MPGVAGTWKDLTDNVNSMASNLTGQVRNIAEVTIAVANGDLSRKITVDVRGEILQLKETINTMVEQLRSFASEVTRVAREVGTEGRLGVQAVVPGVAGTWKDLTDSVNAMGANLTAQVRNIAEVTTAVARGDLSRKITVDVKGEILELKNTINTMVDQLRAFAAEVTRVAREVGTEGKLGGQAEVPGVAGTWKDLTDSVNVMAANLTDQVRGIVKVVTAVANGNLRQKLTVEAKGEVAALAETINNMTDTLATFAEQVTNVAREVGVEGRLGGQANVPGAAGTWKDLTGNVNLLAANLTTQVRAIAEVATAVTKGDLTRSIQVEARGEVAELKDNINTMIDNLRGTTERNQEQDWLKTNLAKFTRMLQGQRDLVTVGKMLLSELAPLVDAQQGTIYQMRARSPRHDAGAVAAGRLRGGDDQAQRIEVGRWPGRAMRARKAAHSADRCAARLHAACIRAWAQACPKNIVVLPVLFEGETKAVIELASLQPFTATHLTFLEQLTQSIGVVLNTIEATMRTENLLQQSQQLTIELQTRQKELQQTNEELAQKAQQLAEQNVEVERKNKEVEQARRALEEKAAELALTSKYKSEFLANMSHELRTPLNSILILGQQLAENPAGNLTTKQVEFARNIHSAGSDLLTLINDILDLSKIESGTVTVEAEEITFAVAARQRRAHLPPRRRVEEPAVPRRVRPALPRTFTTDPKRLQQILKNLLSNAFKFTAQGQVAMSVQPVDGGLDARIIRCCASRPEVVAIRGHRHRHRHRAGEAEAHLRGVPAGRRRHQPQVRRHRAGSGDQPRTGDAARRRNPAGQRARAGQHLHALPAAGLHGTGACRSTAPAAICPTARSRSHSAALCRCCAAAAEEVVPDDRDARRRRRQRPAHRRRRSALRARAARPGARQGIQGHRRQPRPGGAAAGPAVPADGDHARRLPAGHAGLDGAEQSQARSGDAPHSGADAVGRGRAAAWPVARRVLRTWSSRRRPRISKHAFDRIKTYVAPHTKRLLVVEDNEIERQSIVELLGHDDIEITAVGTGAEALDVLRDRPFDCCVLDLRPARHDRLRAARTDAGEAGAARRADRGLHRQGAERARKNARCARWPRASCSRTCSRRSGCSTRRRCSCTASSPTCPSRSGRCSSGCTARTRSCAAARCSSSTTTRATSSR